MFTIVRAASRSNRLGGRQFGAHRSRDKYFWQEFNDIARPWRNASLYRVLRERIEITVDRPEAHLRNGALDLI
jgi:hypothetical protein